MEKERQLSPGVRPSLCSHESFYSSEYSESPSASSLLSSSSVKPSISPHPCMRLKSSNFFHCQDLSELNCSLFGNKMILAKTSDCERPVTLALGRSLSSLIKARRSAWYLRRSTWAATASHRPRGFVEDAAFVHLSGYCVRQDQGRY